MSQKKDAEKKARTVSSTDPGSITVPPAEGRSDINGGDTSEQEPAANALPINDQYLASKDPAEGRDDVAEDLEQEAQQSYSARHHARKGKKQH